MDEKQILAEAKSLIDKARAVVENKDAPAEDKAKVQGWIDEAKKLQGQVAQMKEIAALGAGLVKEAETKQEVSEQAKKGYSDKFETKEEFLKACWLATTKNPALRKTDPRLVWFDEKSDGGPRDTKAAMAESVGATGGFLVPQIFQPNLQAVAGENAIVRSRATIIRMTSRSVKLPVLNQFGTTSGQPHWFGGIMIYHEEEAAAHTESEPTFKELELVAHKMTAYSRCSQELLADSAISLADFLTGPMGMQGGLAWQEDYDFLRGDGVGKALGIINAAATITVNRTATNPAVQYTDLVNMLEHFLPSAQGIWIINLSVMSTLLTMSGPTGNASYLWGNASTGVPGTLLGRPVIWTEKTPTEGNAGDVCLFDLRYYLIGDRQAFTIESTPYDRWVYDQISWKGIHRVDGQPWMTTYFTLQDGTLTVSPFVILGAKST